MQCFGKTCGSCSKTVDNFSVVNISVAHTGDFRSEALPLRSVTSQDESRAHSGVGRRRPKEGNRTKYGDKTGPDMRRPPPGGRAGVVPTADSGGEEPDRVSTVANDP